MNEESGNLQVVNDGGELTRNINQKKKSDVLKAYRYVAGGSVSSITMSNIVNQLSK